MITYRVKNWRRFQHYKDRNPPWIKLHWELLSSMDWVTLDDASRVLAVACMLVASRNDGEIRGDECGLKYLERVAHLHTKPDLKPLITCGLLECASDMLATCLKDAIPEKESLSQNLKEKPIGHSVTDIDHANGYPAPFLAFWSAYPKKIAKGDAFKAWKKVKPSEQLSSVIIASVEAHKKTSKWTENNGQFIPNPATFLNGCRWEDETREFQLEKKFVI